LKLAFFFKARALHFIYFFLSSFHETRIHDLFLYGAISAGSVVLGRGGTRGVTAHRCILFTRLVWGRQAWLSHGVPDLIITDVALMHEAACHILYLGLINQIEGILSPSNPSLLPLLATL
jgi:hypothetical protein